jgi:nucleobase:cation symporter-1, NCS1 family
MAFLTWFLDAEAFDISMYQVASSAITRIKAGSRHCYSSGGTSRLRPTMLNGYVGCIYAINFPVLIRLAFAVYGAYFVVFIRGVVACVWRCPPMFHCRIMS